MVLSIRSRITFFLFGGLFLILGVAWLAIHANLSSYLFRKAKADMRRDVQLLDTWVQHCYMADGMPQEFSPLLSAQLGRLRRRFLPYQVLLLDLKGVVRADSDFQNGQSYENHLYRREFRTALECGFGFARHKSILDEEEKLVLVYKSDHYALRLCLPLREIEKDQIAINNFFFTLAGVLLIAVLVISIALGQYLAVPLRQISSFLRGMSRGRFEQSMPVHRSDEIGQLQSQLNDVAGSVAEQVRLITYEKQRLESVIGTITEALVLIDGKGTITLTNNSFKKLFPGYHHYVGLPYYRVINSLELSALIERALRERRSELRQLELVRMEEIIIQASLLPVAEEAGLLVIIRDITAQKRFEKQKSTFFANASHELKTPLSIVSGYVETLMADPEPGKQVRRQFLQRISSSITRLTAIVGDISTLNKLEAGQKYYDVSDIDLFGIIDGVVLSLTSKAEEKKIKIKIKKTMESGLISGNQDILESLFFNLLDNAINYNIRKGRISIIIEQEDGRFLISIEDTGSGFPPEEAERLFERFYRVDTSRSRERGGTGLGLSIARFAALFHGGTITAYSEGPGKGAQFVVILPGK